MQEVHIDSNFPVIQASIVDPYVALLTQNGRLLLYELVMEPYVQLREVDISATSFATWHATAQNLTQLTSISIYADASEIMKFAAAEKSMGGGGGGDGEVSTAENAMMKKEQHEEAILLHGEDDDFLYGDEDETIMEQNFPVESV